MKKIFLFVAAMAMMCAATVWGKQVREQELETSLGKDVRVVLQENISSMVKFLKYCNKDKNIFSLSEGQAALWDAKSGDLLRMLVVKKMGYQEGNVADISPDGKFCFYITPAGAIEMMNMLTGDVKVIAKEGQMKRPSSVAVSPDGKWFGVTSREKIFLYDAACQELKHSIRFEKQKKYNNLSFGYDSKHIACSALGSAIVYDFIKDDGKIFNDFTTYTAFSKNNKYVSYYLDIKKSIVIRDLTTKNVVATIPTEKTINFLDFSQNGKSLLYITDDGSVMDFDIATGMAKYWEKNIPEKKIFYSIGLSTDEKKFALGGCGEIFQSSKNVSQFFSGKSSISKFYVDENGFISVISGKIESGFNSLSFDPTQTQFLRNCKIDSCGMMSVSGIMLFKNGVWVNTYYEGVSLHDLKSDNVQNFGKMNCLSFLDGSDEATLAFLSNDSNLYVYDVATKKQLLKIEVTTPYVINSKLSPQKRFLALCEYNEFGIYDVSTGKKIFSDPLNYRYSHLGVVFSSDDKLCAFDNVRGPEDEECFGIDIYETHTKKLVKHIDGATLVPIALSSDTKFMLCGSNNGYFLYNLESDTKVFLNAASITKAFFSSDKQKIITWSEFERNVHTFSAKNGQLLTTIVVDDDGNYLAYTPDGYFSGSDYAVKNFVHIVDGMKVSELGQYAQVLYRSDMVAAKLEGQDLSKIGGGMKLADVVSTGDAPIVQFANMAATSASRDATVSFSVQDQGGGIGSVYIKLNGKAIQLADGSRKLALDGAATGSAKKSGAATISFSHPVTLQNGENIIEAYATNSAGKIESRHAVTKISWKGATQKPSLYVFSVGVNKYRDKSLWLQYSVPDAEAVAKTFGGQKSSLYQNVYTRELFDGDVTKEGLAASFADLSSKVKADDVFVLFVAGHGTTNQKTGDYYFIPSNFRYTDADAIIAQGVSKDDILKYMSNIKAEKTLIMLDTCNSGAFTNDKSTRGFVEKSALERLVRSTGQAVLTAASDEQVAMEGYNGHGIFTYVLLEALNGKADRNKDGYLTLNELASYIEEQVPELSYQKWGYEQVPMKELRKQDFPLVGK